MLVVKTERIVKDKKRFRRKAEADSPAREVTHCRDSWRWGYLAISIIDPARRARKQLA